MLFYFEKSSTLEGRGSYIWPVTIQKIIQKPIIGHGVWSDDARRALYLNKSAAIHSHNQLLEVLFVGGIVFVVLYSYFFFMMYKKNKNAEELYSARILLFGWFVFGCSMTVEVYMREKAFLICIILFLMFYTREIDHAFSYIYNNESLKI